MLLPESHYIDLDYLMKIIEGKKKLISLERVRSAGYNHKKIIVNKDKLQNYCWDHPVLKHYVPDHPVDKEYLIKLLSVLDKPTLDQLNEISIKRLADSNITQNRSKEGIRVCSEFAPILLGYPVTSKPVTFKISPGEKLVSRCVKEEDNGRPLPMPKRKKVKKSEELKQTSQVTH